MRGGNRMMEMKKEREEGEEEEVEEEEEASLCSYLSVTLLSIHFYTYDTIS